MRILSCNTGSYPASVEQQKYLCFTDDGSLYISDEYRTNPHVLAYCNELENNNVIYKIKYEDTSKVRDIYLLSTDSVAVKNTEIQNEVIELFKKAKNLNASDIHFRIHDGYCLVLFRINGMLEKQTEIVEQTARQYISAIYQSMCAVADPVIEWGIPQDAKIKEDFIKDLGLFGARFASRPSVQGYLCVLRLFYGGNELQTLESLGYLPEQIMLINKMIKSTDGVVLVCGPTGSGKSTTLQVIANKIIQKNHQKINFITIEDPPETPIPGSVQTPLIYDRKDPNSLNIEWAKAIANLMRLDPDQIMPGEIRDIHGAKACIDAAMTGHNVWTTLHTKDPIFALTRLCNMGIDIDLVTDSSLVIGLIGQRLARKICYNCKLPYANGLETIAIEERLFIEETCELKNLYLRNPKGCYHCRYSGFSGRTTIAEVITTDADFMRSFIQGGARQAREHWFLNGGVTKNQHMIARINQGILDPIYASHDICPLDQDKKIFGSQFKKNSIEKPSSINLDLITG
ncbi:MAG: GspE/PulE family protein (plasmid) [Candidatus Symbiodolus clandestinus]